MCPSSWPAPEWTTRKPSASRSRPPNRADDPAPARLNPGELKVVQREHTQALLD
jgi:hypothetical protein